MEDISQTVQQKLMKQCTAMFGNFSCLHVLHGQVYIFSSLSVFSNTSSKKIGTDIINIFTDACRLLLDTKVCQEGTVGEREIWKISLRT